MPKFDPNDPFAIKASHQRAHDFNNILSAVLGYTEMALEDAEDGSLIHSNLQGVFIAGNRAKDLVAQILTFSRQADQDFRPVQVELIVKEAIKLLKASLPKIQIKILTILSKILMLGIKLKSLKLIPLSIRRNKI